MSAKSLIARPADPSDRGVWDAIVSAHGSIFNSLRWTDIFTANLARIGIYDAGGNLRGGFCLWEERRYGLRVLRNPPYTREIGPFYEPRASNAAACTEEQRAVVEAMAAYLSSAGAAVTSLGLALSITDCLPFRWRGWKVVPSYTYRIDLSLEKETLLAALSVQQRNPINKAVRDGVSVDEVSDTSELRLLVLNTFARQNKGLPVDVMDRVLGAYPPGAHSYCFVTRHEGLPIAAVYVVHDLRTAYCLMTGYDDARSHSGAGALAMWHAILKAKDLGLEIFDFEGSVIPPIERYFRGFGGVLTPLFNVHRAWLPIEMGLKLFRRHMF